MVKPFLAQQALLDATVPPGWRYYWRSEYLRPLSPAAIDTVVDRGWSFAAPLSYTLLFHMGGAVRHVADADTAFTGRDAELAVNINMVQRDVSEPDDTEWVRSFHDALRPFGTGGVYVNFLGNEGSDRVRHAYGEAKWARLVALKRQWDPGNLFRVNQNIPPDVV
jgi:FAD/FMN-containing dehydrogenase